MTSNNDKKEGNFIWTEDEMINFCNILITSIEKNGCAPIQWNSVYEELKNFTRTCSVKTLKNKYDVMKRD